MNCQEAQYRLADLIDGRLPDTERAAIETHLASCHSCAGTLGEMRSLTDDLHRQPQPWSPPAAYWDTLLPRIHQRIDARNERGKTLLDAGFLWLRRLALPAAVVMLLVAGGVFLPGRTDLNSPGTGEADIAELVGQLPEEELDGFAAHVEIESEYDATADTGSILSLTEEDRDEIAGLLAEEDVALSTVILDSDAALLAANEEVFELIEPELEEALADNH